MPQGIVSQADYYGLPQPERAPAPAPEHVAELLKAPQPWSGPTKIREAAYKDLGGGQRLYYSDDYEPGEPWTQELADEMAERNMKAQEGNYFKEAPHLSDARQQREQVENRGNR